MPAHRIAAPILFAHWRKKLVLAAAALFLSVGAGTSNAAAGGYYGGYYGYHGYYKHRPYYKHRRHHRRYGRYRHHRGGGEAAAIALGVIGGAIILNELAENRARQRAYDARYYPYRTPYRGGYGEGYSRGFDRGFDEGFDRGQDAGPARPLETPLTRPSGGDDLDAVLDGGPNEAGRISVAEAYQTCLRRVRSALSERGFIVSAPFEPDTAEDIGGAWKMTATVLAQRGADDESRAMYCEADETRVYLVELI